jgi:alpha-D-xyloside xylohydrolase
MRAAVALAVLLAACGDDATPPPAQVSSGNIVIDTNPLALHIGNFTAPLFVEIGNVPASANPRTYWDPAQPEAVGVTFTVPKKATAWDAAQQKLTLEGGATLQLGAGEITLVHSGKLARFVLPVSEDVYGMGGTEDTPVSRGVVREMQLRLDTNSKSSTNERHVPVPLAIYPSSQLGFFAEDLHPGAFDVGAARPGQMLITFVTQALTLHPYQGDARSVLAQYLQGMAPHLPPEWAWFPFQWRDSINQADLLDDANQMRANHIPDSTIWIDNPWQTGYNTFEFDTNRFPDIASVVQQLTAQGYRMMVWSTPYVDPANDMADHDEGAAMGFFVTDGSGKTFDWPWSNGPGALVDFYAPGATAWWQQRIKKVTDLGFRGFKLDYGEDLVPDLVGVTTPFQTKGGGTNVVHNFYAGKYQAAYLDALPPDDGFLLVRAGAWGTQQYTTAIWPGDLDNDFRRHSATEVGGLPAAISVGLSLSASGFPYYGSDIGGFRDGAPTPEALVRWAEYAALGTIMQLGGGGLSHNPWDSTLYPGALPIYQKYARLHADLFPYLLSYAKAGKPITLAPGMMVPGHPYEDDFFVGNELFVAPVVEQGATTRTVTLPPGDWIDWWTGTMMNGTVTVPAPLDTLPLWRQRGGIVVMLQTPCDTLLPATAAGVISCADPANMRGIRVIVTPAGDSTFALHDGGSVETHLPGDHVDLVTHAGTRHTDFRFELDWGNTGLPAPTSATCGTCFSYDPQTKIATVTLSGDATACVR